MTFELADLLVTLIAVFGASFAGAMCGIVTGLKMMLPVVKELFKENT